LTATYVQRPPEVLRVDLDEVAFGLVALLVVLPVLLDPKTDIGGVQLDL